LAKNAEASRKLGNPPDERQLLEGELGLSPSASFSWSNQS
jgi:hypothetical protein